MDYKNIINSTWQLSKVKSPIIFSGLAIGGVAVTTYLAITATPKALWILDNERERIMSETGSDEFPYFDLKTRIKYAWRPFVPAIVSGVLTVSAIVLAQRINDRRLAALAGAYTLSEKALAEYKDKIVETFGASKEEKVRTDIANDHISTNSPSDIVLLGDTDQLCYDELTGRYFKSNINDIKAAQNNANAIILTNGFLSLNEFNDLLELKYVGLGDAVGWREDYLIDLFFSSHLTKDGRPCLSVEHRNRPKSVQY